MSAKLEKSAEKQRIRQRNYRARKKQKAQSLSDPAQEVSEQPSISENSTRNVPPTQESPQISCHHHELSTSNVPAMMEVVTDADKLLLFSKTYNNVSDNEETSNDDASHSASDPEDFQDPPVGGSLKQNLRILASKIPKNITDELLRILHPHHKDLPLSAKTLLKSDLQLHKLIRKFNGSDPDDKSEFAYFGVARFLYQMINPSLHPDSLIKLIFDVDGMSPYKSSSLQVWAHMGKVDHHLTDLYQAFIIAAYSGIGKPSSADLYLHDFIEEMNNLCEEGITIEGREFKIQIKCFGCDRPARSFLKCIVNHGGYYACERCWVEGINYEGRVVYPFRNEINRTDESFKLQSNPEHHKGISPLLKLKRPINLVLLFLLEIMHLLYLGNMKKLLTRWFSSNSKLTREMMLKISLRLVNLSNQIPSDFRRSTRSLSDISKWTANEFRLFLLYVGPFVLRDILPKELYDHFLLLHVGCRILCSKDLFKKYTPCAKKYLQRFVLLCEQLYGLEFLTLTVHSLVHLYEDVESMEQNLSDFTAYPFENLLGILKRFIRSGYKPLVQICKMVERDLEFKLHRVSPPPVMKILKAKEHDEFFIIQKLRFKSYELSSKKPNNIVFLRDKSLLRINSLICTSLTKDPSKVLVVGEKLEVLNSAFEYPLDSSLLQMHTIKEGSAKEIVRIPLSEIYCKGMLIEIYELPSDPKEMYAMPLLH